MSLYLHDKGKGVVCIPIYAYQQLLRACQFPDPALSTVQVLVFNCDGEFDFKSVGRIFIGLVKCGAWGCFDEFNRLEEDVLSAVSQQIQLIQVQLHCLALHTLCKLPQELQDLYPCCK